MNAWIILNALLLLVGADAGLHAQDTKNVEGNREAKGASMRGRDDAPTNVLTQDEMEAVDVAVNCALMAGSPAAAGWFISHDSERSAGGHEFVRAGFMAAAGHNPGEGRYGEPLEKAIKYIMSCQKENGLVAPERTRWPADRATLAGNWASRSLTTTQFHRSR